MTRHGGEPRSPADALGLGSVVEKLERELAETSEAEWERRAAAHRELDAVEASKAAALRARVLVECGASSLAANRVLLDPTPLADTAALAAVRKGDMLLVLSGPTGTGKTTAATWWLMQPVGRRLVDFGAPRQVDASELEMASRYDADALMPLRRAGRLVIDDLGLEMADGAGAFATKLDALVNARYAAQLPTLLTTNMLAADFKSRFGARIADRVRETGRWVALAGASLRVKRGAQEP